MSDVDYLGLDAKIAYKTSRHEAYLDAPAQARGNHAVPAASVQEAMTISPPCDAHSDS